VINAIEQSAYIIDAFHRWYRSDVDHVLGKRNIVPTDIKIPVGGGGGLDGRGGNSTVPNMVEITYDIRTLVGDNQDSIIELVEQNIERVVRNGKKRYPHFRAPRILFATEATRTWTGVHIEQPKFAPAWKTDQHALIVGRALQGVKKEAGYTPRTGSYSFCTDGSGVVRYRELFAGNDVQIIGFGPGKEENAHTVNESVGIDDLKSAFLGFRGIARELTKKH
jgi:acetylornithine deacetylase/succinyl-diaminopimelate desuccinylase-like protein